MECPVDICVDFIVHVTRPQHVPNLLGSYDYVDWLLC